MKPNRNRKLEDIPEKSRPNWLVIAIAMSLMAMILYTFVMVVIPMAFRVINLIGKTYNVGIDVLSQYPTYTFIVLMLIGFLYVSIVSLRAKKHPDTLSAKLIQILKQSR